MDTKIHRPQAQCTRTGRPFRPGDEVVSVLVRTPGGLERRDFQPEAWADPPADCVARWRCRYPAADGAGCTLAPNDVLLDVVEQLEGDPGQAPLRYLLALELVRRRVLRFLEPPAGASADDPATLRLGCRKRDCEYEIAVTHPAADEARELERRLTGLLWSGEAA